MPRLIALGNNICHALDARTGAKPTLGTPTDIGRADNILHHDWTCTVASRPSLSSTPPTITAWGDDPLVGTLKAFDRPISRVIKTHDRPVAVLSQRRIHLPPDFAASGVEWDDVVATDLGPAVAFRRGDGVHRFPSLPDLYTGTNGVRLSHPFLHDEVTLAASEARVLLLSGAHVLELVFDARGGSGSGAEPRLVVLDAFEGLGVERVSGAPGNRFAAISAAGEGFVLDALGGVEVVRVRGGGVGDEEEAGDDDGDGDDEVADLALGGGFELVLVDAGAVWARGDSKSCLLVESLTPDAFGQLGLEGPRADAWTRVPVDGRVLALHAGRMSSLLVVADSDND
ncbi:uncharacterized protein LOC62_07G009672 [Vanrija pseudolonga]|uniref:Uncharacterized protein n=1 Tax=Vanrija pseudolonga TaxID=143232 RepID=A0AAF0YG74_9TREE|nr:hypothetical protein LOC62_07G009672 [Vanrija pseudolonga]